MNFEYNDKTNQLLTQLRSFMEQEVYPIEKEYIHAVENAKNRWKSPEMMQTLKQKAKDEEDRKQYEDKYWRNEGYAIEEFEAYAAIDEGSVNIGPTP